MKLYCPVTIPILLLKSLCVGGQVFSVALTSHHQMAALSCLNCLNLQLSLQTLDGSRDLLCSAVPANSLASPAICITLRAVSNVHNYFTTLVHIIVLYGQAVETVGYFKYVGTHIDDKLSFTDNADFICEKATQRQFLIRKLRGFGIIQDGLERVIESLLDDHYDCIKCSL